MRARMWKLHRYYLKELTVSAAITFLVLFVVALVLLVSRGLIRAQGGGMVDAALITLLWALDSFPHLLPVSLLLATVLTYARAAQDREMVAVRSAGISLRVPMTAALLLGLLLSIMSSLGMHYVMPEVHFRKFHIGVEVTANLIRNMGLNGDRITLPGSRGVMTFRKREQEDFLDCTLYCPRDRGNLGLAEEVLHIARVSIPRPSERSTSLQVLLQGVRYPISHSYSDGELRLALPLRDLTEKGRRKESDSDLGSDQLLAEVLRGVHPAPSQALYTLHRRTCYAIMPALFAPIGFCIAMLARDRGRAVAILFALMPLLLFYAADVIGAKLIGSTDWSLCGLLPVGVLLLFGGPSCWRTLRA